MEFNMNLDIPKNDTECWERYPKQHWVYDLSRLLDAQNIKWSPYKTPNCLRPIINIDLKHSHLVPVSDNLPGFIYIAEPIGETVTTEVYIIKGEIKLIRHIDTEFDHIIGEIELRINAFVTLYFQRFSGVISVTTIKNDIFSISLRPVDSVCNNYPVDAERLIKKIYKKQEDAFYQEPAIS